MNLAILSDIHGNFLALQAVLADLAREPVDRVVFLGDAVMFGPQPRETMALLRSIAELTCILGNTDEWLFDPPALETAKTDDERLRIERVHWGRAQLDPADFDFARTFNAKAEIQLGDCRALLAYHGTPQSAWKGIYPTTPEADLETIFAGRSDGLAAGGHTHLQMSRPFGELLVINPGSVGLPTTKTGDRALRIGYAQYARINSDSNRLSVDLRSLPLDRQAIAQSALASDLPGKQAWAADWL